jgi:hypothetical protein
MVSEAKRPIMNSRQVLKCLALILAVAGTGQSGSSAAAAPIWSSAWTKIPSITLIARADDPRIESARAAIDYWNRRLAEIGTPFRLGAVRRLAGSIAVDELNALNANGSDDYPLSVERIPGDIVIALSDGDIVSFTVRWPSHHKALVGIRTQRLSPLSLPNVTRNVIAHELGHVIGLDHNADPTALMCGRPARCRPDMFASDSKRFFPLTSAELAQLRRLYPSDWQTR